MNEPTHHRPIPPFALGLTALALLTIIAIVAIYAGNLQFQSVAYMFEEDRQTPDGGSMVGFFSPGNSTLRGGYTKRRENGELEWTCYYNEQGERDGLLIHYFPNGNPAAITTFVDGVQDGMTVAFHSNGTVKQIGWLKDGKVVEESRARFPESEVNAFIDALGEDNDKRDAERATKQRADTSGR